MDLGVTFGTHVSHEAESLLFFAVTNWLRCVSQWLSVGYMFNGRENMKAGIYVKQLEQALNIKLFSKQDLPSIKIPN